MKAVTTMNEMTPTPDRLTTWYLEITALEQAALSYLTDPAIVMLPMRTPDVRYYKFLYTAVGDQLRWRDRLIMPETELLAALMQPGCSVHVLYADGVPAGYYELVRGAGGHTELAYFGLRPQYHGHGIGRHLLSCAIQHAFADDGQRVWVHTCNLDAPSALPNYRKRGFVLYNTVSVPMPERYKT